MRWLFCVKLNDIQLGGELGENGIITERRYGGPVEKWNLDFCGEKELGIDCDDFSSSSTYQ